MPFRFFILICRWQTLFSLLLAAETLAQPLGAELFHSPPANYRAGESLELKALYYGDAAPLSQMLLMYRAIGGKAFVQAPFQRVNVEWQIVLAGNELPRGGLEYFILAETLGGGAVSFPAVNPESSPILLQDMAPAEATLADSEPDLSRGTADADLLILSPEPGSTVAEGELIIAVSLFNVPDADLSTVRLMLGKEDITKYATISPDIITVVPPKKLISNGTHTVTMQLASQFGTIFKPLSWSFSLAAFVKEEQEIYGRRGRFSLEYRNEKQQSVRNDLLRAQLRYEGSVSDVRYGLYTNWVSNDDPRYQPRSVYNVFLESNYLELYLGDFNPSVSRLGLWGTRVRGTDINLKLGLINFHFVRGQLLRPVTGNISYFDSTRQYQHRTYTYGRNVLALRPSFGQGEKFQAWFSLIQSRDDTTSLHVSKIIPEFDEQRHSLERLGNKPVDNLLFALGNELHLDGRRLSWSQELAFSLTNRNIAPGVRDSIALGETVISLSETLDSMGVPFNPNDISFLFIFNENTVLPLPAKLTDDLALEIQPLKFGKYPTLAYLTNLSLNYYQNYITVELRRIAPEFVALANPGNPSDTKIFDISDRIRLFHNSFFINLQYRTQRDHLIEGTKEYTTRSSNMAVALSLMPGPELPTANVAFRSYLSENNAAVVDTIISLYTDENDQLREMRIYRDPRLGSRNLFQIYSLVQPVTIAGLKNDLNFTLMLTDRSDQITNRPPNFQNSNMNIGMWSASWTSRWQPQTQWSLSYTSSQSKTGADQRYLYNVYALKLVQKFFSDALVWNAALQYTDAWGTAVYQQGSLQSEFRYNAGRHQFSLSGLYQLLQQKDKETHNLRISGRYSVSL
jgi:hypothetical protein